jgi:hypothetical protein
MNGFMVDEAGPTGSVINGCSFDIIIKGVGVSISLLSNRSFGTFSNKLDGNFQSRWDDPIEHFEKVFNRKVAVGDLLFQNDSRDTGNNLQTRYSEDFFSAYFILIYFELDSVLSNLLFAS